MNGKEVRFGHDTIKKYDIIAVKEDHYLYNQVMHSHNTNIGFVIDITCPDKHDRRIINILFGNGIFNIISGYNDSTGTYPVWCTIIASLGDFGNESKVENMGL